MDNKIGNKKAQLSMFIIGALIMVVVIVLTFLLLNKTGVLLKPSETPQQYIEKCVQDSLSKTENSIIEQNFYPNLSQNFMVYYGKKVPYLCKTSQFYMPCVNQEPMLIEKVRKIIENATKKDSDNCFNLLVKNFQRNGYDVKENKNRS
jgi:hypothetical protein